MLGNLEERFFTYLKKNLGNYQRYKAFTLAEVLITLGIIGIVAAMTIPTLVNNVQKMQYVVALKKFYTTQTSGWTQILADEGVNSLQDTSVFQNILQYGSCHAEYANPEVCKPFFDNLKKYFKFEIVSVPSYKLTYLGGGNAPSSDTNTVLVLPDGSVIVSAMFCQERTHHVPTKAEIAALGGHMYYYQVQNLIVDVNGFKKPNQWGRDIFEFDVSDDGRLYPYYGRDWSIFLYGNLDETWKSRYDYCGVAGDSQISGTLGYGCTARIMDEGWEMNY